MLTINEQKFLEVARSKDKTSNLQSVLFQDNLVFCTDGHRLHWIESDQSNYSDHAPDVKSIIYSIKTDQSLLIAYSNRDPLIRFLKAIKALKNKDHKDHDLYVDIDTVYIDNKSSVIQFKHVYADDQIELLFTLNNTEDLKINTRINAIYLLELLQKVETGSLNFKINDHLVGCYFRGVVKDSDTIVNALIMPIRKQ